MVHYFLIQSYCHYNKYDKLVFDLILRTSFVEKKKYLMQAKTLLIFFK